MTHADPANNGAARQPRPRLRAEWALVIELPQSGITLRYPAESQGDAFAHGRRCTLSTWHVEKRFVGPWHAVSKKMRTAIIEVGTPKPTKEYEVDMNNIEILNSIATLDEHAAALVQEPGTDEAQQAHLDL